MWRLICKWLSRDVGFVVRRTEKPGCPDRCRGQMLQLLGLKKKKKEVNLITNRDLNPCMCAMTMCVSVCTRPRVHQFKRTHCYPPPLLNI